MVAEAQPVPAHADPIALLIREGNHREAVALCARHHGAGIGRLCMAMLGSQAEAEETTQETLIAAHDAMASWRGEGSIRAWLFGIARHLCARRIEMRVRREQRLRLVHDAGAMAGVPEDLVDARRRALRVRDALERLKPSERDALLMRYEAGLSFREIGEACGLDEATARKRASRALARLRDLLKNEGGR